jgi:hypothetical protein
MVYKSGRSENFFAALRHFLIPTSSKQFCSRHPISNQANMYFLRASLSVTVLSFFLGTTYAQDYDPESSSIIPTITAPSHTMITNQPEQASCLLTVNGIVINTCTEATELSATPESRLPHVLHEAKCDVTIDGHVYDTCATFTSTFGGSQITVAPRHSPSNTPEQKNCFTTIQGVVYNICSGVDILTRGCRQLNAACLTTLTAHEGHVVVVDCGDGFESGYPPTMTPPPSPSAEPTTVCIENRCFDVIGTFGSPASATATPTQTQSKDEL